jgi:hypothetical protein
VKNEEDKPIRVLVFPSCSEPGLEIVRALIDQPGLEVMGGSSLPRSQDPSSLILRHHVSLPWLGEEGFRDALASTLRDLRIQVVFPATDDLIAALSRTDRGEVTVVAPRPEIAEICLSKGRTYARLKGVVPVPRVYEDAEVLYPAYAKPHEEAGMRGHMRVNDSEDLAIARRRNLVVTEFLPGEEYEVNCLSDLQGTLLYTNIRRLGRRVGGHILDSQSLEDTDMTTHVETIAAALRIEGPWFAQFKGNRDGRPVLIEVNARMGGGSGLNRFCGVNLPLLAVKLFAGQPIPEPIVKRPASVSRSLQFYVNTAPIDRVLWKWDSLVRVDGKVNPRAMACLFDLKNRGIRQYLLHEPEMDVHRFLEESGIPGFFEETVPFENEPSDLCREEIRRICPEPFSESVFVVRGQDPCHQEIGERFPDIRLVTPDALELLGMEGLV